MMVMVLFIKLTVRLGACCKNRLPAPRRPEQDPSPGKAIHSNKSGSPNTSSQTPKSNSIDQNILERHQKRTAFELSNTKREIYFLFLASHNRALYIGKLTVGFQQRSTPRTDEPDTPPPPPPPPRHTHPNRSIRPVNVLNGNR